jgi:hypothetical protein
VRIFLEEAAKTEIEVIGTEEKILLRWKVHLAGRDKLYRPVLAVVFIAFVLVYLQHLSGQKWVTIFGCAFLFLSLADYFFPLNLRLTNKGAYRSGIFGTKFLPWERVKHCYLDDKGIKLSVLPKRSALEGFKGLYLYFGDNRDELVEEVRRLAPVSESGKRT